MPVNNPWDKGGISKDIKKHTELNENESIIYQNIRDAGRTVLGEKFIAPSAYIGKLSSATNNPASISRP